MLLVILYALGACLMAGIVISITVMRVISYTSYLVAFVTSMEVHEWYSQNIGPGFGFGPIVCALLVYRLIDEGDRIKARQFAAAVFALLSVVYLIDADMGNSLIWLVFIVVTVMVFRKLIYDVFTEKWKSVQWCCIDTLIFSAITYPALTVILGSIFPGKEFISTVLLPIVFFGLFLWLNIRYCARRKLTWSW